MKEYNFDNNTCIAYVSEFEYDTYLKVLAKEINDDDIVKSYRYQIDNKKVTAKSLIEELKFFDGLNLKLRDVYILNEHGDIDLSNVRNINIDFNSDYLTSCLETRYFKDDDKTKKLNEKLNIKYICESDAKRGYIHEITHTQIDGVYNLDDEYNDELLSIYMELLYAYLNNDNIAFNLRLNNLKTYILYLSKINDDYTIIKSRCYIKSILQAISLFKLYINSNSNIKNEINSYIQKVFDIDILLEDMLDHFEIDYDKSKVDYQVLKKIK